MSGRDAPAREAAAADAPGDALRRDAYAEFERLLDADAAAREAALAALRRDRPALQERVRALLEADARAEAAQAGVFAPRAQAQGDALAHHALARLHAGVRRAHEAMDAPAAALAAGARIGPYAIERPLGSGGMGEVWLARRAASAGTSAGAPVALKLLHPHLARSATRARFVREGLILGELRHDHVARLLDAGVHEDGRPWLALEHVEGERIDLACDRRRLDVRARLRLFLQVCAAVAHAHARLVVHRDLKPSNILVTPEGSVKLLDFGIAKLIADDSGTTVTEITRLGARAFTPEYAAPEQIAGGTITTATDVHALGALLYLLLSGVRPFGARPSNATQVELEVLHSEPPPPSAARASQRAAEDTAATGAPRADALGDEAAACRATTPRKLRESLRGDLDTLVMKALKKSPEERYDSVQAMADDIRRHLDGQPLHARPDSFAYRAGKFLRRNRYATGVAALLALALVGGSAGIGWEARQAREQRVRAERIRDFVLSIFHEQDPERRPGAAQRTPAQLVAAASQRLDTELQADPLTRAELLDDLGEVAGDVGDFDGAESLLQRAVRERGALFGADSVEVAESLVKLERVRAMAMRRADAIAAGRRVQAMLARIGAADSLVAARNDMNLARELSYGSGAPPEVVALHRDAIAIFERRKGHDDAETADAMLWLAGSLGQSRRDVEAEALFRDGLARLRRARGPRSMQEADADNNFGPLLQRAGKEDEAEAVLRSAVSIYRERAGTRSESLGFGLVQLGAFYTLNERTAEADAAFAEADAIIPPDAQEQRGAFLRERGRLALLEGRPADAERDLRAAFEMRRAAHGAGNAFTWYFQSQWARALAAEGRLDEAEAVQREARRRVAGLLGAQAYQNSLMDDDLADTLARRPGAQARAEIVALRRDALALTQAKLPRTHPLWAQRALGLAVALAAPQPDGAPAAEAARDRREAIGLLDGAVDDDRTTVLQASELAHALALRGHLRRLEGDAAGAHADLAEAVRRLARLRIGDPAALARASRELAALGSA